MHTEETLQNSETLQEIKEILAQASFPCSRNDVLKCAKDAHAPSRIMKILEMLPYSSRKFQTPHEVIDHLGKQLETGA